MKQTIRTTSARAGRVPRIGPALTAAVLLASATALAQPGSRGPTEALAYPIVDTGQERTYGDRGPIRPPRPGEAFYGQDAQVQGRALAFRNNGDGTVTDLNTGLSWQKMPDFERRTWVEASAYARSLRLGGHRDWRVPTMKELFSIADFRGSMRTRTPYLDRSVFDFVYPDPASGWRNMDAQYWSSNRYVGTTMRGDRSAFGFNFADGRIKAYPMGGRRMRHDRFYVRCVRGAPYGQNDFVDNRDGTVTDRATGLTWTKADSRRPMAWREALRYAEGLTLAGRDDWRLPNVKELQSLVDYGRAPDARSPAARGPAIDPVFALTAVESWCWTRTTHGDNLFGYYVCFGQARSALRWRGAPMNAHGAGAVGSDPKAGDLRRLPDSANPRVAAGLSRGVLCMDVRARAPRSPASSTSASSSPEAVSPEAVADAIDSESQRAGGAHADTWGNAFSSSGVWPDRPDRGRRSAGGIRSRCSPAPGARPRCHARQPPADRRVRSPGRARAAAADRERRG